MFNRTVSRCLWSNKMWTVDDCDFVPLLIIRWLASRWIFDLFLNNWSVCYPIKCIVKTISESFECCLQYVVIFNTKRERSFIPQASTSDSLPPLWHFTEFLWYLRDRSSWATSSVLSILLRSNRRITHGHNMTDRFIGIIQRRQHINVCSVTDSAFVFRNQHSLAFSWSTW